MYRHATNAVFYGFVAWLIVGLLSSCVTKFTEFRGECVLQEWKLANITLRYRQICDLPPPDMNETQVRDREAMDVNPFPDLLERNDADSTDPNLLEKKMGYPQLKDSEGADDD